MTTTHNALLLTLLLVLVLTACTAHTGMQGYVIERVTTDTSSKVCCAFQYHGTNHTCETTSERDCSYCNTACATYNNT